MTSAELTATAKSINKYRKQLILEMKQGLPIADNAGLRYRILPMYIKMESYKTGLRYVDWIMKFVDKQFNAKFLFEHAFLLFQCNLIKEAERILFHLNMDHQWVIDRFYGIKTRPSALDYDQTIIEMVLMTESFDYHHKQPGFIMFGVWIKSIFDSKLYIDTMHKLADIETKITDWKKEDAVSIKELVQQKEQIINLFFDRSHCKKEVKNIYSKGRI